MKRFVAMLASVVVAVAAFAFDFTGKTFRGETTMDGVKVTITYRFKAGNRLSGTLAIQGRKPQTDNGMIWEVSGDYINIFDSTGDMSYMQISGAEYGNPVLTAFDSYGREAMTFYQVKSAAPAGKKKK